MLWGGVNGRTEIGFVHVVCISNDGFSGSPLVNTNSVPLLWDNSVKDNESNVSIGSPLTPRLFETTRQSPLREPLVVQSIESISQNENEKTKSDTNNEKID